jgi:hypothetical protein
VASPNLRARGGEQEREMGGSAQCHMEEGKWERERALGTVVNNTDHEVRMAPSGAVGGGSARSWLRQAGEQGRVARRGRRGAVDRWGQVPMGLGGQRRGADRRARATQCRGAV